MNGQKINFVCELPMLYYMAFLVRHLLLTPCRDLQQGLQLHELQLLLAVFQVWIKFVPWVWGLRAKRHWFLYSIVCGMFYQGVKESFTPWFYPIVMCILAVLGDGYHQFTSNKLYMSNNQFQSPIGNSAGWELFRQVGGLTWSRVSCTCSLHKPWQLVHVCVNHNCG